MRFIGGGQSYGWDMDSVIALVESLAKQDQPMLTWYGQDGDRVDLSGRTVANWITKATNLLTVELSAEPGMRVWLDLPTHWRTLVWLTAVWCAGAEVAFSEDADAVITADPREDHDGMDTVVIALPALARRVEDLPADAIDGAADLMTQADVFMFPPANHGDDETGLGASQRELLAVTVPTVPLAGAPQAGPHRVLVTGDAPAALARYALAVWARGGSLVLTQDPALAEQEGATHLLELTR